MVQRRSLLSLAVCALLFVALIGSGATMAAPPSADAQETVDTLTQFWLEAYDASAELAPQQVVPSLDIELLAKAKPDECFNGIGEPYTGTVPICEYGVPKVNQAYVWGLTKPDGDLWFGTAPNVQCLVLGSYLAITTPIQTDSYVCEFGESQYSPPLPPAAGDWRPPDLFLYSTESKTLAEKTPADPRIQTTLGLRSAGTLNGVVLLGGPGLLGGINLFAYNAETQEYLGSTNLAAYDNIRKWLVVDGVLYTGVRDAATGGGHMLRWTGSPTDPFQFEVVGNLASEVAELALYKGRLFVTTWPNIGVTPPVQAGLYMSPIVPDGGLTSTQADLWQEVWQAGDYEPDPVTAATYGGGALHEFDGYLYWGTMHVPFVAAVAHLQVYGQPADPLETVATVLGTHRAISIFRGRFLGTPSQEIELVYGSIVLPAYDPVAGWDIVPNNMGTEPLWGRSGFGNFYNNYTWTMDEYVGQLYVGTMDWSYLLEDGLPQVKEALGIPQDIPLLLPKSNPGADLYRFSSADVPAVAESLDGLGNPTNYGIRTMLSDDRFYFGMANPMNLLTDPVLDRFEGGWELRGTVLATPPVKVYLPLVSRGSS